MVNVLLMATDINVIVNQDIPAANVKVSITSHDFFRNYQSKFLLHIYKKMTCCLSFVLVLRIRTILKMDICLYEEKYILVTSLKRNEPQYSSYLRSNIKRLFSPFPLVDHG